jgi:hypothetical protein
MRSREDRYVGVALDFLNVRFAHFFILSKQKPLVLMAQPNDGSVLDSILFPLSGIWENNSEVSYFEVRG